MSIVLSDVQSDAELSSENVCTLQWSWVFFTGEVFMHFLFHVFFVVFYFCFRSLNSLAAASHVASNSPMDYLDIKITGV